MIEGEFLPFPGYLGLTWVTLSSQGQNVPRPLPRVSAATGTQKTNSFPNHTYQSAGQEVRVKNIDGAELIRSQFIAGDKKNVPHFVKRQRRLKHLLVFLFSVPNEAVLTSCESSLYTAL